MKRLIGFSVSVLSLALAGCGEESDELPVDGRDFDGVEYSEPAPYTGKVIDGYLNNARVWLDMDGDSHAEIVLTSAKGLAMLAGHNGTVLWKQPQRVAFGLPKPSMVPDVVLQPQDTGRRVAIKVLREGISSSDSAKRRFKREVELVASLQHPAISTIVDARFHRGHYFYVMEYIEGPYANIKGTFHPFLADSDGRVGGSPLVGSAYMDSSLGGRLGAHGGPDFPTPQEWLDNADVGGMETIFIFPTTLLGYASIIDPDYLIAITRAYNNWAHDFCSAAPERLKFCAQVPGQLLDEMVVEMRRAVEKRSAVSIFLPRAIPDKMWHHPDYDQVWQTAVDLEVPLAIHGIDSASRMPLGIRVPKGRPLNSSSA